MPYPILNARFSLPLSFRITAGTPTDPTTPDTEFSTDGGATFTDCAEEITTGGGNGMGYLTLTGAETNNRMLLIAAKSANCVTTPAILHPRSLAIVGSGTLSAGSSGGGTLGTLLTYDVTGCFIRTTGGTGGGGTGGANNQARRILTYNTSSGAFTVSAWETTPDATTTYDILLPEGVTLGMLRTLNPTTAGNTLDVTNTGEAGIDWANVGGKTTTNALTNTTIATVTNQLTAAAIATGVWQDATAGDFTAVGSIGKSLFTSGVVPGAAGGLLIAGSNAATTFAGLTTGAFACTTFTASGAVAFQSTFAVTTSTALAALSCTTLTASGAVAFQSTLIVTGATTFTGAITGTNAGNDLRVNGIVPGAAGGPFIAGTNAATTITTSLTTTFTGNLTGNVGGNVTGSVGSIASGGIAASSFASGAIDATAIATDAITSAELAASATAEIAAAVWDLATSGHTTSGTFGAAMNAAGSAGDPLSTAVPGSYGAGTAGYLIGQLGTISTAVVTTIPSAIATVQADTDNLQTRLPSALTDDGHVKVSIEAIQSGTNYAGYLKGIAGGTLGVAILDGAITDATIVTPTESSGRPTTLLAMLRRLFEWTSNKRTRDRNTGTVLLRNSADSGTLETQTQSTSSSVDSQTKGV